MNGAQLHAASAIRALNRRQLHMGCSDESCTPASFTKINRKREERVEGRQKEEEKHGQEERKVIAEKQGLSHLCKHVSCGFHSSSILCAGLHPPKDLD